MTSTIATLTGRPDLVNSGFDEPPYNPLHLLRQWLKKAEKLGVNEPGGLVLSTIDSNLRPSSRVVLLKALDDRGALFASSSMSKKGQDLLCNPYVSCVLWWRETMQQVSFCGASTTLSSHASDIIWYERTREAQAVATISNQSAPMTDEAWLRQSIKALVNRKQKIERPTTWHCYHIAIHAIEFWHGSKDRFHNRLRYDLKEDVWQHKRLQP